MKIAHIIIGLNVGGAELMLQRLVLNSSKKEHFEHCVISLTDLGAIGPALQAQGVSVYTLGTSSLATVPLTLFKLRKLLKDIKPDVVQTWMYHADFLGGLTAKNLGIRNIIWGIRNTSVDNSLGLSRTLLRTSCAKLSYRIPSDIVCVAHEAKDKHVSIGYDPQKMVVIPNGFDLNKFKPDTDKRNTLRTRLNIKSDEFVLGNIGRYHSVKNQVNFIKACIYLLEKGWTFKVLLAGRNVDIDNPDIAILFKNKKLIDSFIFLGEIDDTPSFYNALDTFCLCSSTEGFPNVLAEAMATGVYCLTTRAGDSELILAEFGAIIPSTNYIDIAEVIEVNVLSNSKSEIKKLGKLGQKSIEDRFALEKIVLEFEKLYT